MTADWPVRLRVEMQAGSKRDLLFLLHMQAEQFFGDEPFRLDGQVDAEVSEETRTVNGQTLHLSWTGLAYFESARDDDR